jgi:hypothetical protein
MGEMNIPAKASARPLGKKQRDMANIASKPIPKTAKRNKP